MLYFLETPPAATLSATKRTTTALAASLYVTSVDRSIVSTVVSSDTRPVSITGTYMCCVYCLLTYLCNKYYGCLSKTTGCEDYN